MKAAIVALGWLAAVVWYAVHRDDRLRAEAVASDEWQRWVSAGHVTEFRLHPSNPAWRPVDGPRALN